MSIEYSFVSYLLRNVKIYKRKCNIYKQRAVVYTFLLLAVVNSLRDVPPSNSIAGRQSVLSVGSDNLVEASMNEHIRVHVQQRSRVPVPLHDLPLSALLL